MKHADFLAGKSRVIKETVKELKLAQDEVIYIGDTIGDIKDSKRAGIKCIAVTWGYNTEALLKKYGPTWLANKPKELLQLITIQ